jgi:predicted nucleic acid-binding protein
LSGATDRPRHQHRRGLRARLLISSTVLGELLAGFACGDREARNREELRRFLAVDAVQVIPMGLETADAYGLIYRSLRQQGTPIPSNDLWIAASCLEHGALLFSLDAHFERVPGLRLVRSWVQLSMKTAGCHGARTPGWEIEAPAAPGGNSPQPQANSQG